MDKISIDKKEAVKQILLAIVKGRDLCSYYNKCNGDCDNCIINNLDFDEFLNEVLKPE